MKVLQINSFFSVGGPPRIMNGIYDTLRENGFDCKIAAAREKMYAPEDSYRICSDMEVKVNALMARLFDNEGFNARWATKRLVEYIKAYDPDIVHLHNLHGYCVHLGILFDYLKKADKPVVWTLHDCWTMTGHCAHFVAVSCDQWKTGCCHCPQIKEYPASFFVDGSRRNYAAKKQALQGLKNMTIVTPSAWLSSFVQNSILGGYPTRVIHNGISLNTFSYTESDILEKHRLAGKKIVLGVAQNWAEKKGLEDFARLANILDDHYKIVLIGMTDEQKAALPKAIYGLTRTENIQELVKWYSAADIFVNFTYQDTFPTVNIEALACGTPVLTYRTGGSPEAIDDRCGWVVEQGDIEGAKKIITNITDKSLYFDGCTARSKIFDRRERYLEYVHLYLSLLQGDRK